MQCYANKQASTQFGLSQRKAVRAGAVSRRTVHAQATLAARPPGRWCWCHIVLAVLTAGGVIAYQQLTDMCMRYAGLKLPAYDGELQDVDPEIADLIRSEKKRQVAQRKLSRFCPASSAPQSPAHTETLCGDRLPCRSGAWS
jgi:hypothetical protein